MGVVTLYSTEYKLKGEVENENKLSLLEVFLIGLADSCMCGSSVLKRLAFEANRPGFQFFSAALGCVTLNELLNLSEN